MAANLDQSVARVVEIMSRAVDGRVEALRRGGITQEPDFTSQMISAIETALDNSEIDGIRWNARVMSDRGRNSEEKVLGADLLGVLDINTSGLRVVKGFLGQGKLADRLSTSRERLRLAGQCEKMLKTTDESFVFIYGQEGVLVQSASVHVSAGQSRSNIIRYSVPIEKFFDMHLRCVIGDRSLTEPNADGVRRLIQRIGAANTMYLTAADA